MNNEVNDSDLQAAVILIAALTRHDPREANLQQLPEKIADVYDTIRHARELLKSRVALKAAG